MAMIVQFQMIESFHFFRRHRCTLADHLSFDFSDGQLSKNYYSSLPKCYYCFFQCFSITVKLYCGIATANSYSALLQNGWWFYLGCVTVAGSASCDCCLAAVLSQLGRDCWYDFLTSWQSDTIRCQHFCHYSNH